MEKKSMDSEEAPCMERCSKFCYNPLTKTFCGRTCKSWILIVIYYILFCLILLALFLITVNSIISLMKLEGKPIYDINKLSKAIELSVFPIIDPKAPIIMYSKSDESQQEEYSNEIKKRLEAYTDKGVQECSETVAAEEIPLEPMLTTEATTTRSEATTALTTITKHTKGTMPPTPTVTGSAVLFSPDPTPPRAESPPPDVPRRVKRESPSRRVFTNHTKPCKFDISLLDDCATYPYGYPEGEPCIYLRFNKKLGWVPKPYTRSSRVPKNMPAEIKELISSADIPKLWILCEGHNPWDKDNLMEVTYFPDQGFDTFYFPFKRNENYQSPLVAVKISPVQNDEMLTIACNVWMDADYPIQAIFNVHITSD